MTEPTRFKPGKADGWVVRSRYEIERPVDKVMVEHTSYWYGPEHGWGNTYGHLDGSVSVWPTKKAARAALGIRYERRGHTVMRASEALTDAIGETRRRHELTDDARTRWLTEVRLGYLTDKPVLEAATTYIRTKARRRGQPPLVHAVRADRTWDDRAECGVRKKLNRHGRRFDPSELRACPRCRSRATERRENMATKKKTTRRKGTARKATPRAAAKATTKVTEPVISHADLAELIAPMGEHAKALRKPGRLPADLIDDVRIRARRAYSLCRKLQGLDA